MNQFNLLILDILVFKIMDKVAFHPQFLENSRNSPCQKFLVSMPVGYKCFCKIYLPCNILAPLSYKPEAVSVELILWFPGFPPVCLEGGRLPASLLGY